MFRTQRAAGGEQRFHLLAVTEPDKSTKKPFALRLSGNVHAALQRWADEELRSLNAQIEFVLREALRQQGRFPGEHPED